MYACVRVCMHIRIYICMCICICMYVCIYICMYVYTYVYTYIPHLIFESAGRDTRYRRYDGGRSRHAEHHHLEMRLRYDDTDCERVLFCEVV